MKICKLKIKKMNEILFGYFEFFLNLNRENKKAESNKPNKKQITEKTSFQS